MRNPFQIRFACLSFALAAAVPAAPAICASVPARSTTTMATRALRQQDFVLAPQERNFDMMASASLFRPLRRAPMSVQTIPITIAVSPTSVLGGNSVTCTITVQEVPAEGGDVLVSCDNSTVLHSPSGSWPYTLHYPAGSSTTRSFTITTSSVSSNTTVRVCSCESDLDISNPANWQVLTSCLVTSPML